MSARHKKNPQNRTWEWFTLPRHIIRNFIYLQLEVCNNSNNKIN